ncbi:MAG: sugar phosphate nucleotidyltransferase [Candidatus Kariarchaeaceae archaeon]
MAVVLAGGIGSRLFPLTQERPKPLIPIVNRPMLDYAIELLYNAGIRKIIIAVKYLGEQIRDWIEQHDYSDIEIIIPDIDPRDTADAVRKCAKYINSNFIVTMADIVTNLDLKTAINYHETVSPLVTICLKPVELPGQFGLTMIDNDSRIHLFLEKPSPQELYMTTLTFTGRDEILHMHHNLANIGIYICDQQMIELLEKYGDLMDFGKHVFPFMVDQKMDVRGYLSEPYWMDAGTFEKYLWVNYDAMKEWTWPYSPNEHKKGENLWIGDNVQISENVKLLPPLIIGSNTIIQELSEIGPNVSIGSNNVIAKGVKLKETVLWDDNHIKGDTSIEQSIIGNKTVIDGNLNVYRQVIPSNRKINSSTNTNNSW